MAELTGVESSINSMFQLLPLKKGFVCLWQKLFPQYNFSGHCASLSPFKSQSNKIRQQTMIFFAPAKKLMDLLSRGIFGRTKNAG